MAKISVCINSLNSEKTIENTLKALSKAYEIILCDMHSEDATVSIAEKYGAKVVYHERAKHAEVARNFCISHATGDWILVVDTDEVVPEKLWDFLDKFADNPQNDCTTVSFPIQDYVFGKPMHCMYRKSVKRFWKKDCAEYTTQVHGMVHTKSGSDYVIDPSRKDLALEHYHIDSFEGYIEKINRYTTLEMDKFQTRGKKFTLGMIFIRPILEFCKIYFLKQGYKDGLLGFIMAGMHTFYQFSRSAKLYEYNVIKKNF
ncbi:MAG: glycosyltransferase family 2 protein [Candidatus Gastranaerophilales bacterium]|nr:glycosyltransferase family 2 protein [Candidatus Gastranaerophilales bacterium]